MSVKLPKLPEFSIPKELALCADQLYALRQDRLAVQKLVDELQSRETAIKDHIIATLPMKEASGIAGKTARVTIVPKTVARAVDWGLIFKYIKHTGSFDLMQRRLSDSAVEERWEHDIEIPGVEKFGMKTLSVNKV